MTLRNTLTALGIGALLFAIPTAADAKLTRTGEPDVSFTATGPGGLKIVGKTKDLAVSDDGKVIKVSVALGNLTTGIALRDKHMKEKYLEVQSFPTADLLITRAALNLPESGDVSGDLPGTMTIHGKSKTVNFHYSVNRSGSAFKVKGTVRVNINDFGITKPEFMGASVKPDVDVSVEFAANDA